MNWIDFAIIVTFIFYFIEGIRRGFIEQSLELIGFFVTVFLALISYHSFGAAIVNSTGFQQPAADPIAFLILWFAYQVVYSFILRLAYPYIPVNIRSATPNRLAGLIPAFLKGVVILAIILTTIISLPVPARLKAAVSDSFFGSRLVNNSAIIDEYFNRIGGGDLRTSLTFLTVPAQTEQIIEPDQSVDLKFTTNQTSVDTASETKMLSLVNEERAKAGVPALTFDKKLTDVGRAHSQDMFNRGYFAHNTPDGKSPFDRMEAADISFESAGENIAYAPSVELAHNGLMRSPGHRANILSTDYHKIGIGVVDGGIYGKMFSQEFTN